MAKKVEPTDAGYVDIELSRPIEIDGVQVTTLRMREPTVADQLILEDMKGSDAAKEVALVANLCEVTPDDIKRLTLRDYRKVQRVLPPDQRLRARGRAGARVAHGLVVRGDSGHANRTFRVVAGRTAAREGLSGRSCNAR